MELDKLIDRIAEEILRKIANENNGASKKRDAQQY